MRDLFYIHYPKKCLKKQNASSICSRLYCVPFLWMGYFQMKEKETKNGLRLLLTFENVKSINKALDLINRM